MGKHQIALAWVIACVALMTAGTHNRARADGKEQSITFEVFVPTDAQVGFDGYKTKSTGEWRRYTTPPVPVDKEYTYKVLVTYQGKSVTRDITLRQGIVDKFDFRNEFPATARRSDDMKQVAKNTVERQSNYPPLSEAEAFKLGTEAYIYGYPLITMEMTRRVMTNAVEPKGNHAPMGQFFNARAYPDASFRDVTAPNADTLYSTAWLDVAKEPYILSLPDENDRYFLIPMLSGWTDVFAVPGKRTTGTRAQKYAITGPNWRGELPEGVRELKSPTSMVWILGRTYCTGTPEDYRAVHALQAKYELVPLSAYGKPYTPSLGTVDPNMDMKTPLRAQVNSMTAAAYFKLLASLLKDNPPAAADAPLVAKMAELGIVPGQDFDMTKLGPAAIKGLQRAPRAAQEMIMASFKTAGTYENGWMFTTKIGLYGADYLQRALVTTIGLGANRPQDAVYPTSEVDAFEQPYNGANNYVMHFAKGQTPPAEGFWSITMYDPEYFFVANPLNKYTVSPRNDLKHNADGSLDVYIQHDSPGKDKEANWLPAPSGKFILMMRLYWPKAKDPSLLDGSWKIPPVKTAP